MAIQLMTIESLIASSSQIYSEGYHLSSNKTEGDYGTNLTHNTRKGKRGRELKVSNRGPSHAMNEAITKQFGTIYYNNKVVLYDADTHILEIRMTMGTATETAYSSPHVVRLAIYAPFGELYDSLEDLYKKEILSKKSKRKGGPGADPQKDKKALRNSMKGQAFDNGKMPEEDSEMFNIDFQENNSIDGWIIPVADTEQSSFGQSFGAGKKVFLLKESIGLESYVRCSCTCSDYYYRISPYNYSNGVHLGPKPEFPIKGKTKPVMNVEKAPGFCKHLMIFVLLLINGGILGAKDEFPLQDMKSIINNRIEHLDVPRKLTDENELRHMYNGVNDTIRTINYQRKTEAQLRNDFSVFKKVQMAKNARELRAGTRTDAIGKDVSYAMMQQNNPNWRADFYNQELKELGQRISAYPQQLKAQALKNLRINPKDTFTITKFLPDLKREIQSLNRDYRGSLDKYKNTNIRRGRGGYGERGK